MVSRTLAGEYQPDTIECQAPRGFPKVYGSTSEKCPFTNLPEKRRTMWALTADEMKECRWLKPELVAQIEFTEWTPDGHLRHSSFVGLRDEKEPRQVRRE
jgi:ATP-dependent DNA ligase